jgi:hypothetical protein
MTEENIEIGTGDGAELAEAHEAAQEAAIAREAESDRRLDATVRKAAEAAFHGEARPRQDADQKIDATIRQAWDRVQARPPELRMPELPGNPTIEETLKAEVEWNKASLADRQAIVHSTQQIKALKQYAAELGVEIKSAADLIAVQQAMGQGQQNSAVAQSSAPSPVWEKVGIGHEVKSDQEALQRLGDFSDRWGADVSASGPKRC